VSELGIYDQQLLSRFDWLREPDPGAGATRRSSWSRGSSGQ